MSVDMSTAWRSVQIPLTDVDELGLAEVYARSYGGTLLARPVVLSEEHAHRTGADLLALLRLLVSLPRRLDGGDLDAFAARVRIPPALRPLVVQGDVRRLPLYARGDLLDDGEELRVVELNVGSELGGVDAAQMARAWLAAPGMPAVADAWGLTFVDTAALTAELLRRAGARVGSPRPRCALVEGRDALVDHDHVFVALREALADHGVDLELAEIQELEPRPDGGTDLRGARVDVVLRYFAADQIVDDPPAVATYAHLERADATDRTALVGSLAAHLLATKAALAVLHDPRVRTALEPAEVALVDRLVPWTALVGELDAATLHRVRTERTAHVLKPGVGYSGVGTVVGDAVDDAAWARALAEGAHGDAVVQRRVHPAPELVVDPHDGRVEEWHANWGLFVTEQGWSGGFVRALRPDDGRVIGYANPGTRGAPVLTSPADAPPPPPAGTVDATVPTTLTAGAR